MAEADREKWNRIYRSRGDGKPKAARVLADHAYLLPHSGKALDLACGTGGNAILLAEHGLETHAWDISDSAVEQLKEFCKDREINLTVQQRDAVRFPPDPDCHDVIVVSRFLDRTLIPHIINALTDNGFVFYQTFIKEKSDDSGPRNPEYLLNANELLGLFRSLHVILYREEGTVGDPARGFRNEAMLIAQKRENVSPKRTQLK